MSGPTRVSPELLEAMWGIAAEMGDESLLETGHPKRDVLIVNGRQVAWSAKHLPLGSLFPSTPVQR